MSMGSTQMKSILSSASTLKSVSTLNAVRTQMNGESRVMASEIKADKGRGVNTKDKEEELAEKKDRIQTIQEDMSNSLTELNERLETDREKIREEEAEKERQTEKEKAEEAKKAPSVTASGNAAKAETIISGIIEPVDTVEISSEAKAAASTEAAAPVVHVSTEAPKPVPSTGKAVDVKV